MKGWRYRVYLSPEESIKFERNYMDLRNDSCFASLIDYYEAEFKDGLDFIGSAFFWDETPEGEDYWHDLALKLREVASRYTLVKNKSYGKKIMV